MTPRARVRIEGVGAAERARLRALLPFLGAMEAEEGEEAEAILVGAGGGSARATAGGVEAQSPRTGPGALAAPRLEIGPGGQFELPRDEALLAEALLAVLGRGADGGLAGPTPPGPGDEAGSGPAALRIALAGWGGSRRGALLAVSLAAACRGVLVDASGLAPAPLLVGAPRAPGVRWADLSGEERVFPPELPDRLVRAGRIAVLGGDARGVARADDPRLGPVLEAIRRAGRSAVVDLGRWDSIAARSAPARWDALILHGGGGMEEAARLACSLALWEPDSPALLVVDGGGARRIAPLLPTARILSMRRALSRGGAAALLEARRAAGRRWAGEWFEGAAHEGKGER